MTVHRPLKTPKGEGVALSKRILRHQDHSRTWRARCIEVDRESTTTGVLFWGLSRSAMQRS